MMIRVATVGLVFIAMFAVALYCIDLSMHAILHYRFP